MAEYKAQPDATAPRPEGLPSARSSRAGRVVANTGRAPRPAVPHTRPQRHRHDEAAQHAAPPGGLTTLITRPPTEEPRSPCTAPSVTDRSPRERRGRAPDASRVERRSPELGVRSRCPTRSSSRDRPIRCPAQAGGGASDPAHRTKIDSRPAVISLSSPSMSRDMSLLARIFHGHDHSGCRRGSGPRGRESGIWV
jgi:hypothetical protein